MDGLRKIEVTAGVYWVEAGPMRVLCGCPADVVKHLMKRGLIATVDRNGQSYETGPNAILLSDVMVQNGAFANLAEFPVLQMLYRQGMILPGHPGNTGIKPLVMGSSDQVSAQLQYIYRGNYGLVSQEELVEAGVPPDEAHDMMRLKQRFAFGAIRHPSDLLDTVVIDSGPATIAAGLSVRRLRLNVFEFSYGGERVVVDLNLAPSETYECPYPLGFHNIPREYFAVVHSGEGDGWDVNGPSMGSVLMFQGKVYLIDAGPNILGTLTALGIGVNEIEGIFHTHSHDDHFAGLTTLVRSDHRIRYYATPMVRNSVAKKMAALLSIPETAFADYFDVRSLEMDVWNDVDGLEVRPVFSPHPVETTLFLFRAMWEGGYRTYAHFADICRLEVLRSFVTDDPDQPGISQALFDRVATDYAVPADVKKIDVGGGMIHGDAYDFRDDASGKIVLAHTSGKYSVAQRAIGSAASFGTIDCLIPSDHDFIWRSAIEVLRSAYPEVPENQLRALLNNPMVTFNPGTILLKDRQTTKEVLVVLSGSVEAIRPEGGVRNILSSGAIVGELTGVFGTLASETYRALGFVKALRISCSLYGEFVRRNQLFHDIARLMERREFLQRTWLFGEVVSIKPLNRIAREVRPHTFPAGSLVDIGPESMGVVVRGCLERLIGEHTVGTVGPGDFFGEEMAVFWTPSMYRLRAVQATEAMILPAAAVSDIPSVRWRLFEVVGKRMSVYVEDGTGTGTVDALRWHNDFRINVVRLDNQHRRLLELANAAQGVAAAQGDPANVVAAIDALREYALYHFGEEEAILSRAAYPEVEHHRANHAAMNAALRDLREEVAAGRRPVDSEIGTFLRSWLMDHIIGDDTPVGPFLNAKGIY